MRFGRDGGSGRGRGRARLLALVVVLGTAQSACVSNAPQTALKPQGHESRITDHLFKPVFWIAVAVFVLAVVRFRARSDDDAPVQIHGSRTLETTWTVIPALLLAGIGIWTIKTVFDVNRIPKGPEVVNVNVIGHRWWWEYKYPASGVTTANELYIPSGKRVVLTLESADVIHSFWPPALAGKVDVVPGQKNRMIGEADHPGRFYGQCAEYCGTSHANMRLEVVAVAPADFQKWISDQQAGPAIRAVADTGSSSTTTTAAGTTPTSAVALTPAESGAGLFLAKGCAGCHSITGVSAGVVGPNLTHFHSRTVFAGAMFKTTDHNLRNWLRNPPKEKPDSIMPNLKLSEDEITNLIAYLDTLK